MILRALLMLLLATASASSLVASQPEARNVLLLNYFETDAFVYHNQILRTELSGAIDGPVNFFEASIQPAPFGPEPQEGPVVEYLRTTLAGKRLDLVISVGGPAATFADKYRDELFPETPLLLAAIDTRYLKDRTLGANDVAITAAIDLSLSLDNILSVLPNTTTVMIVMGNSQVEHFWLGQLRTDFARFQDRIHFEWINDLPFTTTLERAAALPPNSAIFYGMLTVDGAGVARSDDRAIEQMHAVANAPMFGVYDFHVGRGIVGGSMMSMTAVAHRAAATGVRLLNGESPRSITVNTERHGTPTYDSRELQRWGISEAALPAGSVVLFRQPGVWDLYRAYIIGAVVVVALQSALIAGLVVQRARQRRTEKALRESDAQNHDLAGRLINAQEAERARIARDLHDNHSQQLAGLAILISSLKRKLSKPDPHAEIPLAVTTLQDRATSLAHSIRTLSHELHPSVLEHAGLAAAVQRHCTEVAQGHALEVTMTADGALETLRPDVALCLFRVVQEALGNAVRHAEAKTVRVRLAATAAHVELIVGDDGRGFAADERTRQGLGLRSIDERVRLIHGHLTVTSQPGLGTTISVRVPVARA